MFIKSVIWLGTLLASRFIKLSLFIGSATSISLVHVAAPLSASLFSGFNGVIGIAGLMIAHYFFPIVPLKLGLPTLAATLSWALAINTSQSLWHSIANIVCNIFLPITCITLFIMHPVGNNAWVYAMYWLIPVGIAVFRRQNIFLAALQSTFIAHAVGSVIWLYAVPMTAEQWLTLIPLVAVERCTMAGLMSVGHMFIIKLTHTSLKVRSNKKQTS